MTLTTLPPIKGVGEGGGLPEGGGGEKRIKVEICRKNFIIFRYN